MLSDFSSAGGGYSAVQNIAANIQKNQQAYDLYGESQQELVREALELNPNNTYAQKLQGKLDSNKQLSGAQLRKLAAQNDSVIQNHDMQNALTDQDDKVDRKTTAGSVGQPNATVQAANNQANTPVTQADVAKSLRSKGVYSKKVDGIAEAIVARLNGQELTRPQRSILSSALGSPAVQNVISEFIQKKANGIDSARNNVYDEINAVGGNGNGRETALRNFSNQGTNGGLLDGQGQTQAEVGDRSGVPGTLREIGGLPPEAFSATQRRGLISESDAFGDDDYATVAEGSALHQVQKGNKGDGSPVPLLFLYQLSIIRGQQNRLCVSFLMSKIVETKICCIYTNFLKA